MSAGAADLLGAADTDGHFLIGDTASGAAQFTACDLKCDHAKGHTVSIPADTFKGCEFHPVDWASMSRAKTGVQINH